MASFVKVSRKNGVSWKAIIRKTGCNAVVKTFKTKTAARQWAQRIEGDEDALKALGNPKAAGVTVADLIQTYTQQYDKKDLGRIAILKHWKKRIGKVKVVDADFDRMMDERDKLLGEPGKRSGKTRTRSGATVNRYMSAISAVFKLAIENRILRTNPCIGMPRGKETSRFGRALSDTERTALLTACKASGWNQLHLLVVMALSTGARKGELLSLSWADLNFTKRIAVLRDTKNGETRTLLLLPTVITLLNKLPRPIDDTTKLLFPRDNNPHKPMSDYEFYPYWKAAKAEAGVENFRFHDLRHSAASYMVANSLPLVKVAAILGHKTMSMVQRYSHLESEHSRDELERVFADKLEVNHADR